MYVKMVKISQNFITRDCMQCEAANNVNPKI